MVCSEPPTIAVSMTNKRHSREIIRNKGEFTVNIPGTNIVADVDYCGLVSGRKNNKFKEAKESWRLGEKVDNAFSVGRQLILNKG